MVRQASHQDLQAVAKVHKSCFPDSFSTALGPKLLVKFYEGYLAGAPELFLVAENDSGEIGGFCMGYYCESNYYTKNFFKNNTMAIGLRVLWLLLSGNKAAWKKVKGVTCRDQQMQVTNTEFEEINHNATGDLLSICVDAQYRGSGMAQELIDQYQQVLLEQGRTMCLLSVSVRNPRGIRFYERNGFIQIREVPGVSQTYIKVLK